MSRTDRLLDELTCRYALSDRFKAQLRPMVEAILSERFSEDRRNFLLEELAAACQRDQALRTALSRLQESLARLTETVLGRRPDSDA